jgi:ketosteroid isomerase-like protein
LGELGVQRGADLARRLYGNEVHTRVADGDTIAARVTWQGTLPATGQQLTAHIATFMQVRGGKIYHHATYDCYERF